KELARRLDGKGVTVNALHPGGVATHIWTKAPGWTQPLLSVAKLFMLTPEQGGQFIVRLASGRDVEGKSGLYLNQTRAGKPSQLTLDAALGQKLWDVSEKLVHLKA